MPFNDPTLDAYAGNLVEVWRFDELAGNIVGAVNGIVGVAGGAPNYAGPGLLGNYIILTNGAVDLFATAAQASYPAGDFTIAFWFVDPVAPLTQLHHRLGTQVHVWIDDANWLITYDDGGNVTNTPPASFAPGAWNHVVIRRVAALVTIWINGLNATLAQAPSASSLANRTLTLGNDDLGSHSAGLGYDQTVIWNTAISDAAVVALCNGGAGITYDDGWDVAGEQLGLRAVPGMRCLHAAEPVRISHPSLHADQPMPPPEVPGYMLASRFIPGMRCPHVARVWAVRPHMIDFGRRYHDGRGQYRVFNGAEYRVYKEEDEAPTIPADLWDDNASLPHSPAAAIGDGEWHFGATRFNGIIESDFRETHRIDVSGGDEQDLPPTGPADVLLEQRAGGVVRILGLYSRTLDATRDGAADTWAIYYTTDGGNPTGAGAPDATETMAFVYGALAYLAYDLPAQAHGTTVKVLLRTRRSTDYSENTAIESTTADAEGPAAVGAVESWRGGLPEDL